MRTRLEAGGHGYDWEKTGLSRSSGCEFAAQAAQAYARDRKAAITDNLRVTTGARDCGGRLPKTQGLLPETDAPDECGQQEAVALESRNRVAFRSLTISVVFIPASESLSPGKQG